MGNLSPCKKNTGRPPTRLVKSWPALSIFPGLPWEVSEVRYFRLPVFFLAVFRLAVFFLGDRPVVDFAVRFFFRAVAFFLVDRLAVVFFLAVFFLAPVPFFCEAFFFVERVLFFREAFFFVEWVDCLAVFFFAVFRFAVFFFVAISVAP